MKTSNIIWITVGSILTIIYAIIASTLSNDPWIWYFTRIYGLVAYFALFLAVLIGELKMLGYFKFFKYHCELGFITFFMALLHGISALFDRFMWGVNLRYIDYLGFTYDSKWTILLSLGVLMFYLIIVISFTSINAAIRKIGFKTWKKIHYLSYITLVGVFIHSMMLGTDVKTSSLRFIFYPLMILSFSVLAGLFIVRMMRKLLK